MYTYDELNDMTIKELLKIRCSEISRLQKSEVKRQEVISSILMLQEREDLSEGSFVKSVKQNGKQKKA